MEFAIQIFRAAHAFVHRREHLDVAHRIEAELVRHALGAQRFDRRDNLVGILFRDEEEIAFLWRIEDLQAAVVDAVGVGDDEAVLGLPEDFGEPHDRHRLRFDQVVQEVAGADRRQLIDVADEHDGRTLRDRLQQVIRERDVEH